MRLNNLYYMQHKICAIGLVQSHFLVDVTYVACAWSLWWLLLLIYCHGSHYMNVNGFAALQLTLH